MKHNWSKGISFNCIWFPSKLCSWNLERTGPGKIIPTWINFRYTYTKWSYTSCT